MMEEKIKKEKSAFIRSKRAILTYKNIKIKDLENRNLKDLVFNTFGEDIHEKYLIVAHKNIRISPNMNDPIDFDQLNLLENEDNNYCHIHIYIVFNIFLDIRCRRFNLNINGNLIEAHVQAVKRGKLDEQNIVNYLMKRYKRLTEESYASNFVKEKEKDVLEYIEKSIELDLLKMASEKGLKYTKRHILNDSKLVKRCNHYYSILSKLEDYELEKVESDILDLSSFNTIPQDMIYSLEDWCEKSRFEKVLVLCGKSGSGKTSLALALSKSLNLEGIIVSRAEDLSTVDFSTKKVLLIYDDFDFKSVSGGYMSKKQLIHYLDLKSKRRVNIKHGTCIIPKGVARIVTINKLSDLTLDDYMVDYRHLDEPIRRRICFLEIKENLFNPSLPLVNNLNLNINVTNNNNNVINLEVDNNNSKNTTLLEKLRLKDLEIIELKNLLESLKDYYFE